MPRKVQINETRLGEKKLPRLSCRVGTKFGKKVLKKNNSIPFPRLAAGEKIRGCLNSESFPVGFMAKKKGGSAGSWNRDGNGWRCGRGSGDSSFPMLGMTNLHHVLGDWLRSSTALVSGKRSKQTDRTSFDV